MSECLYQSEWANPMSQSRAEGLSISMLALRAPSVHALLIRLTQASESIRFINIDVGVTTTKKVLKFCYHEPQLKDAA